MRQLQGVLWTKGVLLNPQHLQVQDRYLEDKLGFQLSALAYQPWGFLSIEMRDEALKAGEVILSRAAGLFADGLVFDIPGADVPPPPRSLEGHWVQDQPSLTIYLAIPEQRTGGRNVASGDRGTRYSPSILSTTDENTGKAEKDILVASKNFRILIEREAHEGSSVMPVARVVRSESGETFYDPTFVPPIMDIAASDHVLSIARRLVEGLSARSAELSAMRRTRNRGLAEFGRSDIAHFWLLYSVNSFLPTFRHLFEGDASNGGSEPRLERAHPVELYRAMTELAGCLMTFSNRHPKDLPPYDHSRLSECFEGLGETLMELLETAIPSNCVTLPLLATDRSTYAVSLDDDRQLSAIQAYLAVTSEMDQARLIDKAPAWIKVASRDQIGDLLSQAVPGIELKHTPAPPSALQVRGGSQYFRLEMVGPRWSSVLRSRSLAAWVSGDIPDPQLELVLLLPPEE
jgi:type VI secretion system protein ImpJ